MKAIHYIVAFSLLTLSASSCVDSYQPNISSSDVNLLVVDGFLNSGDGSATVRLSHAATISEESGIVPEPDASVIITSDDGNKYPLTEQEPGVYVLPQGTSIDRDSKYQLSVVTSNNASYQSDYVTIKETPPIDSITWDYTDNGLTVRANAHDASGNTKYYRWEFVETWEYRSAVVSEYILDKKKPRYRTNDEMIYKCWRTESSRSIKIASSEKLSEDLIYHFPLTYIPKESIKISAGYSILVRQSAISKSEFDFLEQLQRTTENIGGLFDPQPSQVTGNIHNVNDPGAPVLGFFGAGEAKEMRHFIKYLDLPDHLRKRPYTVGCVVDTLCIEATQPQPFQCVISLKDVSGSEILGSGLFDGLTLIGLTLTNRTCGDCRTAGGVTTKPDFWY